VDYREGSEKVIVDMLGEVNAASPDVVRYEICTYSGVLCKEDVLLPESDAFYPWA
jgi:hypothetical protein